MANIKKSSVGRKDLFKIKLSEIEELPGFNVRHDSPEMVAHIDALAESIAAQGQLEPVTAYSTEDGHIYLTNGHCRVAAMRLLVGRGELAEDHPVLVLVERDTDEESRTLALLTRNSGKPLTAQERSEVVARLEGLGMTRADIARKSGISDVYVAKLATFAAMPEEIKDKVSRGEATVTDAFAAQKKAEKEGREARPEDLDAMKEEKKAKDGRRKESVTVASQEGEALVPKWAGKVNVTIAAVGLLKEFAEHGYNEKWAGKMASFLDGIKE